LQIIAIHVLNIESIKSNTLYVWNLKFNLSLILKCSNVIINPYYNYENYSLELHANYVSKNILNHTEVETNRIISTLRFWTLC